MPGAPNRPPEPTPAPPPPTPAAEPPDRKVLRRLAPSRVALLLDLWKGAPSPELIGPFDKAEAAFAAGDFATATNSLELLSVRFAEPRWPTLPEPFRYLRVPIPAPVPPHWDPDHALTPPERDAKRSRRAAEEQLALVTATVTWGASHSVDLIDLSPRLDEARAILATEGGSPGFYERVDAVWEAVRARVPRPKSGTARPAPAASSAPTEASEA